ncbi:helix-turn-helix domain-containing protein [Bradyrhizobium sp. NP1]|jgi:DNA-binding HxlR family transcriptional regulator|uniref:winged helix-turn-helix transcriptional regulator n=1 Tax=Bradyrhizobium sp. NP1 TaxID=3049772 RepID=UPI0025A67751|nr:helix-turn-helix domain-containing protein [Bradyrhizobium sp. NP1]WJR78862.1 helix-turn-helix domain-containing protein [Bradyrhizobium sp. NP1]
MSGTRYTQFCALARAAEIIGERWTLLIIRELLLGPTRFGDLAARLDGVSPALLTGRLNALVESGVIRRATLPAPFNAQVYELTETGRALQPAIRELIRWGGRFLFPMRQDDTFQPDWVLLALDAIARREPTPACRIGLRVPHPGGVAVFIIEGGAEGTRIAKGEIEGPTIETPFDVLLQILARKLPLDDAIESGRVRIEGSLRTLGKLPHLFDLATARDARSG